MNTSSTLVFVCRESKKKPWKTCWCSGSLGAKDRTFHIYNHIYIYIHIQRHEQHYIYTYVYIETWMILYVYTQLNKTIYKYIDTHGIGYICIYIYMYCIQNTIYYIHMWYPAFSPADSSQDIENRSWRPPQLPCLLVVHASSRSAPQADSVPGPWRFLDDFTAASPLVCGFTMVVQKLVEYWFGNLAN